jgi:hypothetical protein
VPTGPKPEADEAGDAAGAPAEPGRPAVAWCPHCGAELDVRSFVQEYWMPEARVFHCWCSVCGFVADVTPAERVLTHEPAHTE